MRTRDYRLIDQSSALVAFDPAYRETTGAGADVNNCLSAELAVPCCVMKEGSLGSSLVFRPGAAGESYESLRGPFNAEGKPLLVDEIGPIDTPITGSERVKVHSETEKAWLVVYLPKDVVSVDDAWAGIEVFAREAGVEAIRFEITS